MWSTLEFIQHLSNDGFIKIALVLFVGVPVVATVANIISQVRSMCRRLKNGFRD